ncbi:hypothetical protein [Dyella japonica]|uniref:DUF304 domain-containing protein n=1 Tax=Dyella japonica A8 TaxID=1217721 RepID=A0A075JVA5_9GAMM|nr:hypothetical protein [Dyella japonica]AIF46036.1 hypothetical protein HY57_01515 [Dyella japonica A8]
MKHSFPRWFPFLLLVVLVMAFGGFSQAVIALGPFSGAGAYAALTLLGAAVFAFLAWSFIYVWRYNVQVVSGGLSITGIFRTHTIPLSSIAQVITASAPRSGTDSWILGTNDECLAKIAGSLVGFDALLGELGQALKPYQALFYRRETWGPWEMQVAGDTKWVQSEAPPLVRRNSRRLTKILVVGFLLIVLAAGFAAWR